jgi:hypothetical protein
VVSFANAQSVLCHAYGLEWSGESPLSLSAGLNQLSPGRIAESVPSVPVSVSTSEQVVQAEKVKVHYKDTVGWLGKILGEKDWCVP